MTEKPATAHSVEPDDSWLALLGNPNCGKTATFNLLTGLNQKVSNYPGVTVERKTGTGKFANGSSFSVLDLPGSYSISPESYDEQIVTEQVFSWLNSNRRPDAIISVVDASNLSRNLFLTTQLLDLGIPVIVALNMMDRVDRKNQIIPIELLKTKLGAAAVIPMSAKENRGIDELKSAVAEVLSRPNVSESEFPIKIIGAANQALEPFSARLKEIFAYNDRLAQAQALRFTSHQQAFQMFLDSAQRDVGISPADRKELETIRAETVQSLKSAGLMHRTLEASYRFGWLDILLEDAGAEPMEQLNEPTRSEKADRLLTHAVAGPVIFLAVLYFIFHSIFTWAAYPMGLIDASIHWLGGMVIEMMPAGMLKDLVVEGIIGGVGAIVIFLPQILILVFLFSLLEDSGYMSRVAFMLDRFMNRIGLHGRSILPLMSGYACAIPGIMATRTIDSWKERLVTILILPLLSCSARLPIYSLMIAAFIPPITVWKLFNIQGLTLIFMYFLGTFTAIILATVFSRFIHIKSQSSFLMEMPPYRIPMLRSVIRQVYNRGKSFLLNAGKIIMTISIVLWFLAYFPRDMESGTASTNIQNSYAGKIGHAVEPLITPLGFDWKIGLGLITSFAAREVVVSTLSTIYNIEGDGEDIITISDALRTDIDPATGQARYGILMALSLMVFYVFAAQCMATFAIVRQETNSWRWPAFMIVYMTGLAYAASLIVYQGGKLLGYA